MDFATVQSISGAGQVWFFSKNYQSRKQKKTEDEKFHCIVKFHMYHANMNEKKIYHILYENDQDSVLNLNLMLKIRFHNF